MRKKDPNELNKREKAILKFIEKAVKENGYPPSVREIGKAVGLSSTATVHTYIQGLAKKGYIKKEEQKGRCLPQACAAERLSLWAYKRRVLRFRRTDFALLEAERRWSWQYKDGI